MKEHADELNQHNENPWNPGNILLCSVSTTLPSTPATCDASHIPRLDCSCLYCD